MFKECIPVVPAQHYFMGGIKVNYESKTSMENLYAIGETACNGVHGRNRLASNSLLESLVFAKRAALDIAQDKTTDDILNTQTLNTQKNGLDNKNADILIKDWCLESYKDLEALQRSYKEVVKEKLKDT